MSINEALACSSKLHSSASRSELIRGLSRKFEQELGGFVAKASAEELSPAQFGVFTSDLQGLLAAIGRDALAGVLASLDTPRASVDVAGNRAHYRGSREREWLAPFGRVSILRRTYRGDGPGATSAVPLDDACGMRGRYMTPDVEEMAAFASAMLTARETEQLLAKTLPEGPSATAIQNAVRLVLLELIPNFCSYLAADARVLFAHDRALGQEAYAIDAHAGRLRVRASSREGVARATASLLQLARVEDGVASFPSLAPRDAPEFPFRCFMVDMGRNPHRKATLLRLVDAMWAFKLRICAN